MVGVIGKSITLLAMLAALPAATQPSIHIKPTYPQHALEQCIEGWVEMELQLNDDGSVESATVLQADPPGVFEEAALKYIRRMRFEVPATAPPVITRKLSFVIEECEPDATAAADILFTPSMGITVISTHRQNHKPA